VDFEPVAINDDSLPYYVNHITGTVSPRLQKTENTSALSSLNSSGKETQR
jgi:hypothetical protein